MDPVGAISFKFTESRVSGKRQENYLSSRRNFTFSLPSAFTQRVFASMRTTLSTGAPFGTASPRSVSVPTAAAAGPHAVVASKCASAAAMRIAVPFMMRILSAVAAIPAGGRPEKALGRSAGGDSINSR